MADIFLIVEGSTEEQFYKKQLQQYYVQPDGSYRHYIEATQMPTKKNVHAREKKGGRVSYRNCVNNVRRFIAGRRQSDLIMLMLDYYGLDPSFSDHLTEEHNALDKRVIAIQNRLEKEIDEPKFRFRLQVHEFEAYLFSNSQMIAHHFQQPDLLHQLEAILSAFGNDPERINDDPKTAPSKRLANLFPGFGKTTDGLIIAGQIGVPAIRERCIRFDEMCRLMDDL